VPDLIPIDDPNDPRVAAYRDIKERDLVGRQGLFIAEGETVLRAFVRDAPRRVRSLLIDGKRIDKLGEVLAGLPPRRPGACGRPGRARRHRRLPPASRASWPSAPSPSRCRPGALLAKAGARAVVLVLMGIANHDNLGGIFRNAAAFGVDGVILDGDCCDPFYRKAIRVSIGATLSVPTAWLAPGEDVVALLERHGFQGLALSPPPTRPWRGSIRRIGRRCCWAPRGRGCRKPSWRGCAPRSVSRWRAASTR
jgi:tRNA G18 (ribose-2'-O)-methylase SpoU